MSSLVKLYWLTQMKRKYFHPDDRLKILSNDFGELSWGAATSEGNDTI